MLAWVVPSPCLGAASGSHLPPRTCQPPPCPLLGLGKLLFRKGRDSPALWDYQRPDKSRTQHWVPKWETDVTL